MIDGTAVKEIERLAKDSLEAHAHIVDVDGVQFTTRELRQVPTERVSMPTALTVITLSGLLAYIEANRDKVTLDDCVVHVVDQATVALRSNLTGKSLQRGAYIEAHAPARNDFQFGQFYDLEQFIIKVQSQFEDAGDRAAVLRVAGTVKAESVRTSQDDGVTQKVVASEGIVAAVVEVPNPVVLTPLRSFVEIDQPSSPFIFRLKQNATGSIGAALIEADGGAWRVTAIQRIADWLRTGMKPELPILA